MKIMLVLVEAADIGEGCRGGVALAVRRTHVVALMSGLNELVGTSTNRGHCGSAMEEAGDDDTPSHTEQGKVQESWWQ